MPARDSSPLWRDIVRQTAWGKRGLSKTGTLWLPVAAVLSTGAAPSHAAAWLACVLLFVASVCRTQGLILANDLADRAEDTAAGKSRWILRLPAPAGITAVVGLLAAGTATVSAARAPIAASAAYIAAVALGLAYSLAPFRLKKRGWAGLVAYAASCGAAYAVLPWAWLGGTPAGLTVLVLAVSLDRWVNLHFHQVIDYDSDAASGTRTYAVATGLPRARRTLVWAAHLASLALGALLAYLAAVLPLSAIPLLAATTAVALGAALHARTARRRPGASSLVRELPSHYLGLTFALFRILPVLLLARLAWGDATMWLPAALAALTSLLESALSLRYRYQ